MWSPPSPRNVPHGQETIAGPDAAPALDVVAAYHVSRPTATAYPMGYFGEFPAARIVDGDTIDVTSVPDDNIRFIGIDTPEVGTPWGAPATEHLQALIAGRAVTLPAAPHREDHDGYGRSHQT